MRPVKQSTEPPRSRSRLMAAAHVAVVLGLYAIGLVLGGGFATAPFPPDLPPRASNEERTPRLAPTTDRHPGVSTSAGGGETPVSTDQAAPWLVGDDGRVHWRVD